MRGRRGGRIGIAVGPSPGVANGVFHISEVLAYQKSGGWPVTTLTNADSNSRTSPALLTSAPGHISFSPTVKVRGGTLS